jgi:hypothetical protein
MMIFFEGKIVENSDNQKSLDPVADFQKEVEKTSENFEKLKKVKEYRTNEAYNSIIEKEKELKRYKSLDVTKIDEKFFDQMDREQDALIESLKNRLPFISPALSADIPLSFPCLMFVGGKTGHGKTTASANIIYQLITSGKKVLIISNEERSVDVFNRIICLHKGWNINELNKFSPEQLQELKELRRKFGMRQHITVVDSTYEGIEGATNSLEGVEAILNNTLEKYNSTGFKYDAILIDYLQKIITSKKNPNLKDWEVQKRMSFYFDYFFKAYPAPIVVFGQLKPDTEDGEGEIETRIKNGKDILVSSTFALEVIPDKRRMETRFKIHKSRWSSTVGKVLSMHWKAGRLIDWNKEYSIEIASRNEAEEHKNILKNAGVHVE